MVWMYQHFHLRCQWGLSRSQLFLKNERCRSDFSWKKKVFTFFQKHYMAGVKKPKMWKKVCACVFYNVTFTFFSSESGIPACVHTSHNKIAYYPLWSEKNNRDITRENRENFEILALRSFPTSHVGKKIHLTGDSDHQGVAIIKIFFFKKKKNLKFFSTIFFKKIMSTFDFIRVEQSENHEAKKDAIFLKKFRYFRFLSHHR